MRKDMNFLTPYKLLLITLLFFFLTDVEAQIGRLSLSPLQQVEQQIALTNIRIAYSRPSIKGRKIFGGLVPYNTHWRTGANRNTTIEFSEVVRVGGTKVEAGKYSIITIPAEQQWAFLLYADTDNWDVPETIEEDKIVAQVNVPTIALAHQVENLTMSIDDFTNYKFKLTISWEKTQVSVPIELGTQGMMDNIIEDQLSGPDYEDYYAAATYELESGKNYERGLAWINKAIDLTEEVVWWDYRIKAYMLLGLNEKEAAKEIALMGMEMAQKEGRAYGISEFTAILKQLD